MADADRAISRDPPPRINTKLFAAILTQGSIIRPNYPIRPGDRRRRINALRASCASGETIARQNTSTKMSFALPVRIGRKIRKKEAIDVRFPR